MSGGGKAWLALMAIPPLVVVGGLIALFVWEGARGGVTPKWKKPPATNAVPAGSSP